MGHELPLELIPTDPTGPEGGDLLEITAGGVRVVRKGLLGRRRGPLRTLSDLRDVVGGSANDVAAVGWLSPGAQIAAQREAVRAEGERRELVALRFAGPAQDEVWLLAGGNGAVAAATGLLGGRAPDPAASAAASGIWGESAPVSSGDPAPAPVAAPDGAPPRPREIADPGVLLPEVPSAPRRGPVRGIITLVVVAAIVAGGWFLVRNVLSGQFDRIQDTITSSFPASPVIHDHAPYSETQVLGLPARRAVIDAGLRLDGVPALSTGSGLWTLRLSDGRRTTTVLLYPSPREAAAAARPEDRRRANVLVRGGGTAAARAVLRGLGDPQG